MGGEEDGVRLGGRGDWWGLACLESDKQPNNNIGVVCRHVVGLRRIPLGMRMGVGPPEYPRGAGPVELPPARPVTV